MRPASAFSIASRPLSAAPEGALKTPSWVNSAARAGASPASYVATHLVANSSAVFLASCAWAERLDIPATSRTRNQRSFIAPSADVEFWQSITLPPLLRMSTQCKCRLWHEAEVSESATVRAGAFADAARQLVHRAIGDAEHVEMLDQPEEIVAIGAEIARCPGDALDHGIVGQLAAITRMAGVGDEGDRPHRPGVGSRRHPARRI